MSYFKRLGAVLSHLINVLLFNGNPNESVSARAWREERHGWVNAIEKVLKTGHCRRAHESDVDWASWLMSNHRK